ncbi:MAG: hypothetical protein IPJ82_13745 [Lewinellaceae bacterium]|nr:hypothetical protein [Lewinellaceae bacterium]
MPKANQISLTLSAEEIKAVSDALQVLESKVPFLIDLTRDEKKALKIMGDKTQAFVEQSLEIVKNNAALVPNFVDIGEMERDLGAWKALWPTATRVLALADRFDDTMAALGSDAYRAALDIYAQLPKAADRNVAGAKTAHELLKPFFEKARQKDSDN